MTNQYSISRVNQDISWVGEYVSDEMGKITVEELLLEDIKKFKMRWPV
jgi:hypothetical protein